MSVAEGGRGLSIIQTSVWTIVMQTGTFLGYISFGYLADRFSRKYTYIGFLVVAAVMVPLFAFVRNPNALLIGQSQEFLRSVKLGASYYVCVLCCCCHFLNLLARFACRPNIGQEQGS